MIEQLRSCVEKLQATTGRLEKEAILKEYADNEFVKKCLWYRFNKYVVFGISDKKLAKISFSNISEEVIDEENYNLLSLFEYLEQHNTGRDEDITVVAKYIHNLTPYADLIKGFVAKDINLGVQSTTLNKIYGKAWLPTFDIMLGFKYFDDPDKYVPEETNFILTHKLDGCVSGDTRVMTDIGNIRIADIVNKNLSCNVLTYNEATKSVEYNRIVDYLKKPLDKDLYKITLDNGTEVKITADDFVLLTSGEWKQVKDLSLGDDILDYTTCPKVYKCCCGFVTTTLNSLRGHQARCRSYLKAIDDAVRSIDIRNFIADYNNGMSILQLAEKYNLTYDRAKKLLLKNNINLRNIREQARSNQTRSLYEATCLKKYKSKNSFQSPKTLQTVLKRYGVTNVRKADIIKEKIKNTKLTKYGKLNFSKTVLISKAEKIVEQFLLDNNINYQAQFNVLCHEYVNKATYVADFYLRDRHLLLEVFGDYFHANPNIFKPNDFIYTVSGKTPVQWIWDKDNKKIEDYKKAEFNVLVLWENEILDGSYKEKLLKYYESL